RFVRDLEPRLVARELGQSRFVGGWQGCRSVADGPIEKQLCAFKLQGHFGEFPLETLKLAEQPAELPPGHGVRASLVVCVSADRQSSGAIAEPFDIEAGDLFLEATFA